MQTPGAELGQRLVGLLTERGETLASAESLTAGLVAATVADTPGASAVLVGGVVAYAAAAKVDLLGVPADLIDRVGTVHIAVAGPSGTATRALELKGGRAVVRSDTVLEVLRLALRKISATPGTPAPPTGAGGTVGLVVPDEPGSHPGS